MSASIEKPIVVFDGVCNLCNASVDFIVRHDPKGVFQFASNQSEPGQRILAAAGVAAVDTDTIVLAVDGEFFDRSSATLQIAKRMGFPWNLAYVFAIVPRFVLDAVYTLIAKYRYRVFGRKDSCRLPTPEERGRFLG